MSVCLSLSPSLSSIPKAVTKSTAHLFKVYLPSDADPTKKPGSHRQRALVKEGKVDPGGPTCSPAGGIAFLPLSQHPPRKDRRGNRATCSHLP